SSDQIAGFDRRNHAKHFDLFVSNRFPIDRRGRFHCHQRNHLQQMVLVHIANCASLLIELSSTLSPEIFSHRDLNTLYIVAIPDWFKDGIGKAEKEQIFDRSLSYVVHTTKNLRLCENSMQRIVEQLG